MGGGYGGTRGWSRPKTGHRESRFISRFKGSPVVCGHDNGRIRSNCQDIRQCIDFQRPNSFPGLIFSAFASRPTLVNEMSCVARSTRPINVECNPEASASFSCDQPSCFLRRLTALAN